MHLTVLICTHNRAPLLVQTLHHLNAAARPAGWQVDILVAANACSDDTHAQLTRYAEQQQQKGGLPLNWFAEPRPGKSHALNSAISRLRADWVAVVDDDHRIAPDFLERIAASVTAHPEASMLCGRILPDWDGTEPAWVHDAGPYRIYPLPVPRQDFGEEGREISANGPIPGGGNQILRTDVFARVGGFATELGPQGHNLGGGEDTEFMLRALRTGERLIYAPDIVQYHYVDPTRLTPLYLMRKAYQRSRASTQISRMAGEGVPLYAWRKLLAYLFAALVAFSWSKIRFYLVRIAASLGEISAMRYRSARESLGAAMARYDPRWPLGMAGLGMAIAFAGMLQAGKFQQAMLETSASMLAAALVSAGLLVSSLRSFSRTGPTLRAEIMTHYRRYTVFAVLRLTFWIWVLLTLMGGVAVLLYDAACVVFDLPVTYPGSLLVAFLGMAIVLALQFCRHLLYLPASICASLNFLPSRLYPLWSLLSSARLNSIIGFILLTAFALLLRASQILLEGAPGGELALLWGGVLVYGGIITWSVWQREPLSCSLPQHDALPNILMIGSDTLRADRLGVASHHRSLTPNLDRLATHGALFTQCYVPCARTAPSLLSLLSGTWPHRHGIRDNFVADEQTRLNVQALPAILRQHGYMTAAVSDWCGGDLKKFPLGFDFLDLPSDQWNIKYLIRQGPKGLRLILSLFTHNRFGKKFLPELYYLAGVPLTEDIGRRSRQVISALASPDRPFFLNVFFSTTHPPFGSEYPYYTMFADPAYRGESKFVMSRLTDPLEILRRQGQPKEEFDLDQILDLYDGCVKNFDDEVGRIMDYLKQSGLDKNTIVVVYSDHGMEFFEHETWGQGNSAIGDFSTRVPCIIADPRQGDVGRVDDVVRSIDVMPTLLELVGIAPPARIDGVSLKGVFDGAAVPQLKAFNETGIWIAEVPGMSPEHLRYPNLLELLEVPNRASGTLAIKREYQDIVVRAKDRMIRDGHWKLVYQPTTTGHVLKLYDTLADPACRNDLAAQRPEVSALLWEQLQAWMAQEATNDPRPGRSGTMDCPTH